ncbi:hypothetical protein [Sphingobacterium thalpophilum]|uniref:hypothetical protein n=1 Tax=Sphingobacterium thalpophilum TaxID=259 RepID=UPI003C742BB0
MPLSGFVTDIYLPSFPAMANSLASLFAQNLYIMIGFAFFIHIISGVLFTSFFTSSMLFFPQHTGTAGGALLTWIIIHMWRRQDTHLKKKI